MKVTKTGEPQNPRADMILNLLTKSHPDVKRLWTSECGAKKDAKEITDDNLDYFLRDAKLKSNKVFACLWHTVH
jgi:predicted Mrr-cat superfamily restriction endonuclease